MYHTVKHHLSYASTDCNVKISSQLFADSTIANKITCGKTKCEALVMGVLGPISVNNLTPVKTTRVNCVEYSILSIKCAVNKIKKFIVDTCVPISHL